ncbi:MAG: 6-hydroxymethylpterin diphosphokinase MptE-like protein [bacterium]
MLKKARRKGYYVPNYKNAGRIHSAYNPETEAEKLIPSQKTEHRKFIVLGAGLGYVLNKLAEKFENSEVLLFEPYPELLREGAKKGIWSPENFKKFELIEPGHKEILPELGDFIPLEEFDCFTLVGWPDYQKKNSVFFKKATTAIRRLRQYYSVNLNTLREQGSVWLTNLRENFKHISHSEKIIFPENINPVAVVAAGPSLDKQLSWLKKNTEDLFIICVNTAGPILKKHRINVDIHVAMDARDVIAEDIFYSKVNHLLLSPFVKPEIIGNNHFSFSLLALQSPLTEWMLSAPFLPRGVSAGSVTVTVLDYLLNSTEQPVFLLGGDMEVSGNRYYARGTHREDKLVTRCSRFDSLPGLFLNWQHLEKNMGQQENPRLKDEREWLNMQAVNKNRLFIPPPRPRWWQGTKQLPRPQKSGGRVTFEKINPDILEFWLKKQATLLGKARMGKKTSPGWKKFCFWINQICENPEEELNSWENLLQNPPIARHCPT